MKYILDKNIIYFLLEKHFQKYELINDPRYNKMINYILNKTRTHATIEKKLNEITSIIGPYNNLTSNVYLDIIMQLYYRVYKIYPKQKDIDNLIVTTL